MQCAKCHHHPFEKWSQDDYYGMTAFFARLGTKNSLRSSGCSARRRWCTLRPTGDVTHPRKGGVVKPQPLDGPAMDDPFDRRRKLAEWVTAQDNPFFARNMVNRFWAYTMGRGLVEPIDDMRETNPPSMPELLDALAQDFTKNNYDLKTPAADDLPLAGLSTGLDGRPRATAPTRATSITRATRGSD